jgi:hypothetical protein
MILVCRCGCHFKPNTRHMRYRKADNVNCPECGNDVKIVGNIIPQQDLEIIAKGEYNAVEK